MRFLGLLVLLLLLMACSSEEDRYDKDALTQSDYLYIIQDDSLYGLMNEQGEIVLNFQEDYIRKLDREGNLFRTAKDKFFLKSKGWLNYQLDSFSQFQYLEWNKEPYIIASRYTSKAYSKWINLSKNKTYYLDYPVDCKVLNEKYVICSFTEGKKTKKHILNSDLDVIYKLEGRGSLEEHPKIKDLFYYRDYKNGAQLIKLPNSSHLSFPNDPNLIFEKYWNAGIDSFPIITKLDQDKTSTKYQFYNWNLEPSSDEKYNPYELIYYPHLSFRYNEATKYYSLNGFDDIQGSYVYPLHENWLYVTTLEGKRLIFYKERLIKTVKPTKGNIYLLNSNYLKYYNGARYSIIDSLGKVVFEHNSRIEELRIDGDRDQPHPHYCHYKTADSLVIYDLAHQKVILTYFVGSDGSTPFAYYFENGYFQIMGFILKDGEIIYKVEGELDKRGDYYLDYSLSTYYYNNQILEEPRFKLLDKNFKPVSDLYFEYVYSNIAEKKGELHQMRLFSDDKTLYAYFNQKGEQLWPQETLNQEEFVPLKTTEEIKTFVLDYGCKKLSLSKLSPHYFTTQLGPLNIHKASKIEFDLYSQNEENWGLDRQHIESKDGQKPWGSFDFENWKADLKIGDYVFVSALQLDEGEKKPLMIFKIEE